MVKRVFLRGDETYEPIFFIVAAVLFGFVIFLMFGGFSDEEFSNVPSCGDGTIHGLCSEGKKPYFCSEGTLIEKASICGCSENTLVNGDSCISIYEKNPINLSFDYILRGERKQIDIILYEDVADYASEISREISYSGTEAPSRGDFKLLKLDDKVQREFLLPLVIEIQNLYHDKTEQLRVAVSLAQHVEWGFSNKTLQFGHNQVTYSRYPYEVLYEQQGVCGEKSELLVFLLRELGFDIAFFYNQFENHESVGVKCPKEYSWHNSGYCFIETSGPSIISDSSIVYVGGLKLSSKPELIEISEGISLSDDLYEYEDADDLTEIRKKAEETGKLNQLDISRLEELKEKYGLVDEYNVA